MWCPDGRSQFLKIEIQGFLKKLNSIASKLGGLSVHILPLPVIVSLSLFLWSCRLTNAATLLEKLLQR